MHARCCGEVGGAQEQRLGFLQLKKMANPSLTALQPQNAIAYHNLHPVTLWRGPRFPPADIQISWILSIRYLHIRCLLRKISRSFILSNSQSASPFGRRPLLHASSLRRSSLGPCKQNHRCVQQAPSHFLFLARWCQGSRCSASCRAPFTFLLVVTSHSSCQLWPHTTE